MVAQLDSMVAGGVEHSRKSFRLIDAFGEHVVRFLVVDVQVSVCSVGGLRDFSMRILRAAVNIPD